MSTVRKVAKNMSLILLDNIANKFMGLLIAIFLARYLGVSGYGNYTFITTYALFFGVFIDLGINVVVVREISKKRERAEELIANSVGIKLTLFVLAFLLAFSVINLLDYSSEIKIGVLIALSGLIFTSLVSLLVTIFQADLEMEYPAFVDFVSKLVLLVATFLIAYEKGGLLILVLAVLLASITGFILLYVFSLRKIHVGVEFNKKVWREILGPAVLLGLSGAFSSVILRMDAVLLSLIKGNIEVGYYAPPSQLTDAVTLIPIAFVTVLFPLMSAYSKTSKQALAKSFRLAIKYMLALALPMAFGTMFLSDRIITSIYGALFSPASPALVIMVWCDVLTFCVIITDYFLISLDKQRNTCTAMGIGALSNILLNLLLIPPFGFIGASIALLLSYILLTILCVHYLPKSLRALDTSFIIKSTLASLLMALFIKYSTLSLYVLIPLSALLYAVFLILLGGVSNEDIDILKKIMVRK
jgi:O-antigen/teichoic acid export membrane protein